MNRIRLYAMCLLIIFSCRGAGAGEVIRLWPTKPPGETKEFPPEEDINKPTDRKIAGRRIIKLTNVSIPTLEIFRPDNSKANGTAAVICPGGGHRILAYDLEGTEVAEWLTSLGVTAIVLKYRVPFRNPDKRHEAAVQDAQRAIGVVRTHAKDWGLNPERIGIGGFSAGGETAALAALFGNDRLYEPIDEADKISCRPDFAFLIYPAYLADANTMKLREDVKVDSKTPPMFLVHAMDDRVTPLSSILLAGELKRHNVSAELHVFSRGGHGYGMRRTEMPVTAWPELMAAWLKQQQLIP